MVVKATIEKEKPISLDLSNPASYIVDGNGSNAQWDNGNKKLDVSINGYEGIIFKNPAENIEAYKYVTVTYTSKNSLNAYIFDGQMGDGGTGQNPAGQVQKDTLSSTDTEVTVTYSADNSMHGFKLVRIGGATTASIKSVIFSKTEQENMKVNETSELSVSVDVGVIEKVEWSALGGAATIEKKADDDNKAVVTAVKAGTVTVFAKVTVKDGKKTTTETTAITKFNVKFDVKASISDAPNKMYADKNSNISISIDKGKIKNVNWMSDNETIATVNKDQNDQNDPKKATATIAAKSEGTVTITAEVTAEEAGQISQGTVTTQIEVRPSAVYVDLSNWNVTRWDGAKVPLTVHSDGSIDITFDKQDYFGAGIQIPDEILTKYPEYNKVELSVTSYREDGTKIEGGNQIFWNGRTGDLGVNYGDGVKSLIIPEGKVLDKITINAQESGKEKQIMKVLYIKFMVP